MLLTQEHQSSCQLPIKNTPIDLIVPPLYCPDPIRIDDTLGNEIDDLLLPWIHQMGIFPGQQHQARLTGFGRYIMLCHPYSDDLDRLLLAAQYMTVLFAADDHYCDDERLGAVPALTATRLLLLMSAMDPSYLPRTYSLELKQALKSDPVLVAMTFCIAQIANISSPSQLARVQYEAIAMFLAWSAEAAWRLNGTLPAVREYLVSRQRTSFLPCIVMIDIIEGYELPTDLYFSQPVRHASALAGNITALVNDLYSVKKESIPSVKNFSLPQVLSSVHQCSMQEALALSASIHDDLVHEYEAVTHKLLQNASPILKRYIYGLTAWIAGSREWHRSSSRYHI